MLKDLVSIIVTCYNQQDYIVRALDSVKAQTYTQWECIVVDDESKDKSPEIIKAYIANDNRFKLIQHPNKGLAGSRNAGFKIAKGEYMQFLDGDDTYLPEKTAKQIDAFKANPNAKICICKHRFYYEDTKTYRYYNFEKVKKKPLEQMIYIWKSGISIQPIAPMYKRKIWQNEEVPFIEDYTHWCEDWVFNVLLALKGHEYVILEDFLCNYHMHEDNFTADKTKLITAAIHAAMYLHPKLPPEYQDDFIEKNVEGLLQMYLENERPKILNASKNWRFANAISKPVIKLLSFGKK